MSLLLLLLACAARSPDRLNYGERLRAENHAREVRSALGQDPLGGGAPMYRDQLIWAYLDLGQLDTAQGHLEMMIDTVGPGSAWARTNSDQPERIDQANDLIARDLLALAQVWHLEAEAHHTKGGHTPWPDAANLARKNYDRYLTLRPDDHLERVHLAELLSLTGRPELAFSELMAVVQRDQSGELGKAALERALHLAREMVEEKGLGGQSGQASAWDRRLLGAAEIATRLDPEGALSLRYGELARQLREDRGIPAASPDAPLDEEGG